MFHNILQSWRIVKYKLLKDREVHVLGEPKLFQPVVYKGSGKVIIGEEVQFGVNRSPGFFSTYAYLEARSPDDEIRIGDRVKINNNFAAVAHKGNIVIGDDVLIGLNCSIITSDFHAIDPQKRLRNETVLGQNIKIGNNVFIGNDVSILKGVSIGANSVIGTGAVVVSIIPSNVIAGGNPARVIKELTPVKP